MQQHHSDLAAGLRISRVITGLWQIADMERDDHRIDLDAAAKSMSAYVEAGLSTFDMADHYGSSEEIAGLYHRQHAGDREVQLLTKWVPKPGGAGREGVREAA